MKTLNSFLILAMLFSIQSFAQKSLIELTPEQKQEFINAHNKWRSDVGSPKIAWSYKLEEYAARWATQLGKKGCKMKHRPNNKYGENLYWSSGLKLSPTLVVNDWGTEIKDYKDEVFGESKGEVGHYTQIVWRTTREFGCAVYQCGNEILVVCNYYPSGNWIGKHPYKQ